MARSIYSEFGASFRRRSPLDNNREPRMGRLALVPLIALVLFAALGWLAHNHAESNRMEAVAAVVQASGHAAPVHVEPMQGGECGRASEGFRWRTAEAAGWACAGPGSEVRLQEGAGAPMR